MWRVSRPPQPARSEEAPVRRPTPAGRHRNDKQSRLPFQLCTYYTCDHSGRAAQVEPAVEPQLLADTGAVQSCPLPHQA